MNHPIPPFTKTGNSITVIFGSGPRTVHSTQQNFEKICQSLGKISLSALEELFDVKKAFVKWSRGDYAITADGLLYKGEVVHSALEKRVMEFFTEKLPFEPLLRFHERLEANPSFNSRAQLFDFLQHKQIPIGDDGCFYAYKGIKENWWDKWTGNTHKNIIGAVIEMDREKVDDNPLHACAPGIHAGSLSYATGWAGRDDRLIIVKIDPADVVSVPTDCEGQKIRVCRYEVVSEFKNPLSDSYMKTDSLAAETCVNPPMSSYGDKSDEEYDDSDFGEEEVAEDENEYCWSCNADLSLMLSDYPCNYCPSCGERL